jgi:hypothetical protein
MWPLAADVNANARFGLLCGPVYRRRADGTP